MFWPKRDWFWPMVVGAIFWVWDRIADRRARRRCERDER